MNIKDNLPPLPHTSYMDGSVMLWPGYVIRQIEAAAFARGVAAGQATMQEKASEWNALYNNQLEVSAAAMRETQELRAKLKAMKEQEPVGCIHKDTLALEALAASKPEPQAQPAERNPQEWMPIETAPMDGAPLLLLFPPVGVWIEGAWRGAWSFTVDEWVIHSPFLNSEGKAICSAALPHPTHWMPLPPPPENGIKGES